MDVATSSSGGSALAAAVFHTSVENLLVEATKHRSMMALRDAVHEARLKDYHPESLFHAFVLGCEIFRASHVNRFLLFQCLADIGKLASLNLLPVTQHVVSIACDLLRRLCLVQVGSKIKNIKPVSDGNLASSNQKKSNESAMEAPPITVTFTTDQELLLHIVQTAAALLSACPLSNTSISELLSLIFLFFLESVTDSIIEAMCSAAISQRTHTIMSDLRKCDDFSSDNTSFPWQIKAESYFRDLCAIACGSMPSWLKLRWNPSRHKNGANSSLSESSGTLDDLSAQKCEEDKSSSIRLRLFVLKLLSSHFAEGKPLPPRGSVNPLFVECLNDSVAPLIVKNALKHQDFLFSRIEREAHKKKRDSTHATPRVAATLDAASSEVKNFEDHPPLPSSLIVPLEPNHEDDSLAIGVEEDIYFSTLRFCVSVITKAVHLMSSTVDHLIQCYTDVIGKFTKDLCEIEYGRYILATILSEWKKIVGNPDVVHQLLARNDSKATEFYRINSFSSGTFPRRLPSFRGSLNPQSSASLTDIPALTVLVRTVASVFRDIISPFEDGTLYIDFTNLKSVKRSLHASRTSPSAQKGSIGNAPSKSHQTSSKSKLGALWTAKQKNVPSGFEESIQNEGSLSTKEEDHFLSSDEVRYITEMLSFLSFFYRSLSDSVETLRLNIKGVVYPSSEATQILTHMDKALHSNDSQAHTRDSSALNPQLDYIRQIFISMNRDLYSASSLALLHIQGDDVPHFVLKGIMYLLHLCCVFSLESERNEYLASLLAAANIDQPGSNLYLSTLFLRDQRTINQLYATPQRESSEGQVSEDSHPRRTMVSRIKAGFSFPNKPSVIKESTREALEPSKKDSPSPLLETPEESPLTKKNILLITQRYQQKLFVLKFFVTVANSLGNKLDSGWNIVSAGLVRSEFLLVCLRLLSCSFSELSGTSDGKQKIENDPMHLRDAIRGCFVKNIQENSKETFDFVLKSLLNSVNEVSTVVLNHPQCLTSLKNEDNHVATYESSSLVSSEELKANQKASFLQKLHPGICFNGCFEMWKLTSEVFSLSLISLLQNGLERVPHLWSLMNEFYRSMLSLSQIQVWCVRVAKLSQTLVEKDTEVNKCSPSHSSHGSTAEGGFKNSLNQRVSGEQELFALQAAYEHIVEDIAAIAAYCCALLAWIKENGIQGETYSFLKRVSGLKLDPFTNSRLAVLLQKLSPPRERKTTGHKNAVGEAEIQGEEVEPEEYIRNMCSASLTILTDVYVSLQDNHPQVKAPAISIIASSSCSQSSEHNIKSKVSQPDEDDKKIQSDVEPVPVDPEKERYSIHFATEKVRYSVASCILREILKLAQGYGENLTGKPWGLILKLLQCTTSNAHAQVGTAQRSSSGKAMKRLEGEPLYDTKPLWLVQYQTVSLNTAFRALETIHHNCITNMDDEGLRYLIGCTGAFSRQYVAGSEDKRLHINLSSIQLLWSTADYLASMPVDTTPSSRIEDKQAHSHGEAVSVNDRLWNHLLLELLEGCIDARHEVRQSSQKTLFSLVQVYGKKFSSECWRCILLDVIILLLEILLVALQRYPGHVETGISDDSTDPLFGESLTALDRILDTTKSYFKKTYGVDSSGFEEFAPHFASAGHRYGKVTESYQCGVLLEVLYKYPSQLDEMRVTLMDAVSRVFLTHFPTLSEVTNSKANSLSNFTERDLALDCLRFFIDFCGKAHIVAEGTTGEEVAMGATRALHGLMVGMGNNFPLECLPQLWCALENLLLAGETQRDRSKQCTADVVTNIIVSLVDVFCFHRSIKDSVEASATSTASPVSLMQASSIPGLSNSLRMSNTLETEIDFPDLSTLPFNENLYFERLIHVLVFSLQSPAVVNSYYYPNKVQSAVVASLKNVWSYLSQKECYTALNEVVFAMFPEENTVRRYVTQEAWETRKQADSLQKGSVSLKSPFLPGSHPSFLLLLMDFLQGLFESTGSAANEQSDSGSKKEVAKPYGNNSFTYSSFGGISASSTGIRISGTLLLLEFVSAMGNERASSRNSFSIPSSFFNQCYEFMLRSLSQSLRCPDSPPGSSVVAPAIHREGVSNFAKVIHSQFTTATVIINLLQSEQFSEKEGSIKADSSDSVNPPMDAKEEALKRSLDIIEPALSRLEHLVRVAGELIGRLVTDFSDVNDASDIISVLVPISSTEMPPLSKVAQQSLHILRKWSSNSQLSKAFPDALELASSAKHDKSIVTAPIELTCAENGSFPSATSTSSPLLQSAEKLRTITKASLQARKRDIIERYLQNPSNESVLQMLQEELRDIFDFCQEVSNSNGNESREELIALMPYMIKLITVSSSSYANSPPSILLLDREIKSILSRVIAFIFEITSKPNSSSGNSS